MARNNPNNANQYVMDPRQSLCWSLYTDPKSKTFGNANQSALKAGFSKGYSDQITTRPWFQTKVRRIGMLDKAEKVLEECLEMPVSIEKLEGRGEDAELVVKTDPALIKIKQDTAKFIAERVGKNEGYSTRTELTGAEGEALIPKPILGGITNEEEQK